MGAAPVCRAALAEATRLWPNRNRASDGICADANHASTSDHNDPDKDGFCEAFDLTHDPANGCDAHALVRGAVARRDPRIKYAISQGRIWSAARASEGWRVYTGSNKHDRHAHVSTADAYRDDTSSWWKFATPSPLPPRPSMEAIGMKLTTHPYTTGLDTAGRGHLFVPHAFERVVSVIAQGSAPERDGYWDTPVIGIQQDGAGTRVVITEAKPGGPVTFFVKTLDA